MTHSKEGFARAYRGGWLDEEEVWLRMIADRNLVAHTYNEAMANALLGRVPSYLAALEGLLRVLRERSAV